jgi:hypothetical protein
VIRKPTNYNSIKIDDPQGKLYMQVFADGRELNTYYIDDIAFAVIDANATTIRYIVDATDAEYSTEQYDMTFVSVRSGEVIEQRTMIETIDKNEHQESIIEITPSGSIGSIARSFDVIADGKLFTVEVLSDSTVWNFGFDKYNKQVMFDFRIERSTGFCNVTIPKELLRENAAQPWQIRLDGSEIPFTSKENEAYSFLHFETSSGGTYTVQIFGAEAIPEFSNVWILLLMVTTLLSTTVLLRRSWVRARKRLV